MARGFVIGLFLSAALTLVICKVVDRRTLPPAPVQGAPAPAADASSPTASSEAETLRAENARLRQQVADAQAAREAAAAAAKKTAAAKKANPWGNVARGLLAFLKAVKDDPSSSAKAGKNAQDLFIEMMALLGKIAKERGVALNDALLAPEGLPGLLAGAFEDADPPLTDAERQALEKLAADVAAGWDAVEARKDAMTALEERRERLNTTLKASDDLAAVLSPEHLETARALQSMGIGMMGSLGGATHFAQGSHDEIRDNFSKQWAKALKFDESQASALSPIVEDYLRSVDAATKAFQSDMASGVKGGETKMAIARIDAQIEAQKRIESSFALTKSQKKALDGWATTYVYWDGKPIAPADTTEPK